MRVPAILAALCLSAACLAPPPVSERVTDAARELNLAARFGRMDLAIGRTAPALRETFTKRRAAWGNEIRVVDVELAGLSLPDSEHAIVHVDYAWVRMNEGVLRSTRVVQHWRDTAGWQLAREQRVAGDLGLFGEPVDAPPPARGDVHFATKVIRDNTQ